MQLKTSYEFVINFINKDPFRWWFGDLYVDIVKSLKKKYIGIVNSF